MRTVSFSNPKVFGNLNKHFVNTYTNTFGDSTSGMSIKHAPSEPTGPCFRGNGKQNVQTIFMTPRGEIFHVATGFLSAEDLFEEMEFAYELFNQIGESDSPSSLVAEAHFDRLKEAGFGADEIRSRFPLGPPALGMMMSGRTGFANRKAVPGQGSPARAKGRGFDSFVRSQFLADNKFSIENPMLHCESLENDPAKLVGHGSSFFASSSFGNR